MQITDLNIDQHLSKDILESRDHQFQWELIHAALLTEEATSHGDKDLHPVQVQNLVGRCISKWLLLQNSVHWSPEITVKCCCN